MLLALDVSLQLDVDGSGRVRISFQVMTGRLTQ
jgi:hypothetical protein